MANSGHRIAVEISNSAVRIAEIATAGKRLELVSLSQDPLPVGAVVDGVIVDSEAVKTAIERALAGGDFSQRKAFFGVAGLRAITREIEVPQVSDSELDATVRLQALDVIPFPADKTLLSARPLEEVSREDGAPLRRVLLAAAHRDVVDPLVATARSASVQIQGIDLTSVALVRALYDPEAPAGGPEAIVSIGSGLTTVVVHEDGQPHFVRTIAEGGEAVTAAIAGTLDLPRHDAEVMKQNLDKPGPHIRAASGAARESTSSLVSEIRNSIDYYATLPGRSQVRRVIVTGGGSRLVGLFETLQQALTAPVYAGSCLAKLDCSKLNRTAEELAQLDPLVAVVTGLARPDPTGVKPIDLLPPEVAAERQAAQVRHIVFAVAAALVLVFIGLGALRYYKVSQAQSQVAIDQIEITHLDSAIAADNTVAQKHAALLADSELVEPILAGEVNWPEVFVALRKATPSAVTASGFSGVATTPPAASSASTTSTTLPSADTAIGTISLSYTGSELPDFRTWLDSMFSSKAFSVATFSAITHTTSPRSQISFSATLAITGVIHSDRLREFEVPKP